MGNAVSGLVGGTKLISAAFAFAGSRVMPHEEEHADCAVAGFHSADYDFGRFSSHLVYRLPDGVGTMWQS